MPTAAPASCNQAGEKGRSVRDRIEMRRLRRQTDSELPRLQPAYIAEHNKLAQGCLSNTVYSSPGNGGLTRHNSLRSRRDDLGERLLSASISWRSSAFQNGHGLPSLSCGSTLADCMGKSMDKAPDWLKIPGIRRNNCSIDCRPLLAEPSSRWRPQS